MLDGGEYYLANLCLNIPFSSCFTNCLYSICIEFVLIIQLDKYVKYKSVLSCDEQNINERNVQDKRDENNFRDKKDLGC